MVVPFAILRECTVLVNYLVNEAVQSTTNQTVRNDKPYFGEFLVS